MNYEDQVIKAAKDGFNDVFSSMSPATEKLLRLVYRAGYDEAKRVMIEEQMKSVKNNDEHNHT